MTGAGSPLDRLTRVAALKVANSRLELVRRATALAEADRSVIAAKQAWRAAGEALEHTITEFGAQPLEMRSCLDVARGRIEAQRRTCSDQLGEVQHAREGRQQAQARKTESELSLAAAIRRELKLEELRRCS